MKRLVIILIIASLFLVGCSTEIVEEEQTVEEQIDEAQTIVKETIEETVKEETEELPVENIPVEEIAPIEIEEITGITHLVQVKLDGFDPSTITIKVGDTIQWENIRSGNLNQVLIAGSSPCTKAKSSILLPGETFSWTFNEPANCAFTDAITITQLMKVVVEE